MCPILQDGYQQSSPPAYKDIKVSLFSDLRSQYSPVLSPKTSYCMLLDHILMCN